MLAGRSILFRMSALVLAAMLVMGIVAIAITFFSPPPFRPPVSVNELLAGFEAGPDAPKSPGMRSVGFRDSRTPPAPRAGERSNPRLAAVLADRLGVAAADLRLTVEEGHSPPPGEAREELRGGFSLAVRRGDGWRIATSDAAPWFTSWHRNTLMWLLLAAAVLFIVFYVVGRSITRSLRQLADDARHVGIDGPAFLPDRSAPVEVRQLAAAIGGMRRRYAGFVANRTELLVGIAHDLGTPLTRLAFRIEALPDAARETARSDIDEMQKLIAAALEFARGRARAVEPVALDMLLADRAAVLATDAAPVRLVAAESLVVSANLVDLMRVIDNLVVNAQRHAGNAELSLRREGAAAVLVVRDHGSGIDPAIAARLFDPLYRGTSPLGERAGVGFGLGLAIVQSNVEAMGGTIAAANHPEGGAVFTVALPLSA